MLKVLVFVLIHSGGVLRDLALFLGKGALFEIIFFKILWHYFWLAVFFIVLFKVLLYLVLDGLA